MGFDRGWERRVYVTDFLESGQILNCCTLQCNYVYTTKNVKLVMNIKISIIKATILHHLR